ncbi:MAG: DUF3365 domain-containing protein [Desulforhopalus sp.]|nr:DUF3365 domain-containing protein [Desulforhopalus sp.]
MRKLTTKLMISIGVATIFFSCFLTYQTYTLTQIKVREVVEQQAAMALQFDLAIRKYVANNIRPVMYQLLDEGEFIPETMSTSYIARSIFEDVRTIFPDYIIKFSSDNPRNPANMAGKEELELIRQFNQNPNMTRWQGEIEIDNKPYMALFSARRMRTSCLLCHGEPGDAPQAMLEKYGSAAGFHRPLDDVVGLDTVAIPMDRISEKLWPQFTTKLAMSVIVLSLFFLTIIITIRKLIINRLIKIAHHFSDAATQSGYNSLQHLRIEGQDEINDIANGFNSLSDKLKRVYSSLEMQVVERTTVLETRNRELKEEIKNRTKAQNSLKEQEATMRSIFRAAPTGIGMVSNRVFTQVNKKLCSMLGYSKDELIGQNSKLLYPTDEEYKLIGKNQYEQISENRTGTVETIWRRKDQTLIDVLLSSTPIDSNNPSLGVTFTALDITSQKVAARDKAYLEKRLSRSQKMEALGLLAGGVAHDLNNVLSGIVSYPDLILMELPDDSPLRRSIITMQESGKKAEAIVQDLLTLTRRGVSHTEVLNLNTVISDHLHSPEHNKMIGYFPDIEIITNFEPELLNIRGSSIHLKKTIMNLISNSAEAIPQRGQITLLTENRYVDTPIKGYEEVQEGDFVVLSVCDNGTGIESDDLNHIFEPFYTKKVMGRSGTGLGMSVVWGTIQDHKGYLNVETVIGRGTRFELFFPVTSETVDNDKQLIELKYYLGNDEEILIIDDDIGQREIAGAMLNKLGYKTSTAASGEEGVEFLKNHPVDLVVLDMIMAPNIDGLETYRKIIEHSPGQKAIIASGFSETSRIKEAQRLGVGEYVKKPYTLERIGLAVKNELSSSHTLTQAIISEVRMTAV